MRVWHNGANIERGDEQGADPRRPRARRAHRRAGRGAARAGLGRPARARRRSRDRAHGARAHRPLRPVRAARRAWPTGSKEKPKRASLFASMDPTRSRSTRRSRCCRCRGSSAPTPTANEITAQNGRYGPYLQEGHRQPQPRVRGAALHRDARRGRGDLRPAEAARGRVAKPPLAELGAHPESGAPVRVLDGRFGPYVTDGTTNATVPRGVASRVVTLEQASSCCASGRARAPATKTHGEEGGEAHREEDHGQEGQEAAAKKPRPRRPRRRRRRRTPRRWPGRPRSERAKRRRNHRDEPAMPEEQPASAEAPFIPSRRRRAADPARAVAGLRDASRSSGCGSRRSSRASATGSGSSRSSPSRPACPNNSGAAVSLVMLTRVRARVLPRHRRRRDHRPVRPAQGDGAAATSAAPACSSLLPFVENLLGLVLDLARPRGPHAAVGPGAGGDGAEPRAARSSSRRRTRSRSPRRTARSRSRRSSSRCSPGSRPCSASSTSSPRSRSTRRCSRSCSTR